MANFLLEIGTEELPSRFLGNEEKNLMEIFASALAEAGLEHGRMRAMATPRRLVLMISDVAAEQTQKEEIVTGPPARSAYCPDGSPSPALLGFARGNNVTLENVFLQTTPKGEYVAARKLTGGKSAMEILMEICPAALAALHFPKSMRWGANEQAWARPVRWILALLGEDLVPFAFGPAQSGRHTWGHRVLGQGPFQIDNADSYKDVVSTMGAIMPDEEERRAKIVAEGNNSASEKGGQIIWKDSLLDEVAGLVEHPVPMLGDFDPAYLDIPAEVLLTSMETHQKSFGVRGGDGRLLPHFLTVLNLAPTDAHLVKKGWERVLRARLEDARFFWQSDLATPFNDWLKKLETVIFIGPLGSMGDKGRRLAKLCRWLAEQVEPKNVELAERAGSLAKADLVSGMVGEFDTLQGIMGGIYAERAGEKQAVAEAIKEQYLPAGPDSNLPQTPLGAILSIADKADTLAGCFGLNMIPGGMADPNGLRRCALGIIRILIDRGWNVDTVALFAEARKLYGERNWKLSPEEASDKLHAFMSGRMRAYFIARGFDTPMVDAALAGGSDRIADCKARLDALASFSKKANFTSSVQTLKRVENISRKADVENLEWHDELLQEEAEKNLAGKLREILPDLDANLSTGNYEAVMAELENLRQPVDAFFENVMVNCEDKALRENRLKLLRSLGSRFSSLADFSLLQI